jgi:hypothetical protein
VLASAGPRRHAGSVATLEDVRRIALSLPGAADSDDPLGFTVPSRGKDRGFAWSWKERVHPKMARVPNLDVLAVRVAGQPDKELLLASDPHRFFTEPHYDNYPAVLVRLAAVDVDELRELLTESWLSVAPSDLRSRLRE